MKPRDARPATVLIATLVSIGAWYAKSPDSVYRFVPQLRSAVETDKPTSSVFVRKVWWSPDSGNLLSLARGDIGWDGPLVVHDFAERPLRMPVDMHGESVATAAVARDGRHILVATYEGRLWWIGLESDDRTLLLEAPVKSGFSAAALSSDGKLSALASYDGSIYLCDTERPAPKIIASDLISRISELRFSDDGLRLVSAGQDGWLCVWELQSGIVHRWKAHDCPAMAAAFLSDGRIISASHDDTIRIWEVSTGREIWRGEFRLSGVNALAVSADGKSAAWGGFQRRVVVWDLENARKKYEFQVPSSIVWDVQFCPDGKSLAVAGTEGMLRVYDAQCGTEVAEFEIGQRMSL